MKREEIGKGGNEERGERREERGKGGRGGEVQYLCITRESFINPILTFYYFVPYDSLSWLLAHDQTRSFERQSTA